MNFQHKVWNPRRSEQEETLEISSLDLSVLPVEPHRIHVTLNPFLISLFLGFLIYKMERVNTPTSEGYGMD